MARVDNVGSGIGMEDMLFLLLENLGVETVGIQHGMLCAVRISACSLRVVPAEPKEHVRLGMGGLGVR
jgi:hypothetical protein